MRLAFALALSLAAFGGTQQAFADETDLLILAEDLEQVATDASQEAYFLGQSAHQQNDVIAQQRFNTAYSRLNKIAFNCKNLESDLDFFHSIPRARDDFRSRLGDLAEVERGMAMVRDPSPELTDALATLDGGEVEDGLDKLVALLATRNGDAERIRRVIVAILDELGVEHPLARETRRKMAAALY